MGKIETTVYFNKWAKIMHVSKNWEYFNTIESLRYNNDHNYDYNNINDIRSILDIIDERDREIKNNPDLTYEICEYYNFIQYDKIEIFLNKMKDVKSLIKNYNVKF